MKKFLTIFIGFMLIVPAFAEENSASGQYAEPGNIVTNPLGTIVSAVNSPKYVFNSIESGDSGSVASVAYVKGAYNSALTTTNYLADNKQDKLSSSNVTTTGSGNVISAVSVSDGNVSFTQSNVQVPVGGANVTNSYASIWIQ